MTGALRILMVEDSATDAKLIVQALGALRRPLETERVDDPAAMGAALQKGAWDVVLSDWAMPKFSAMGALALLKETGRDVPFIIVSGTIGEEAAVDAMRAGVRDYVVKDRLARLVPAIERELRECRERAAHRDIQARFARLADSGLIAIAMSHMNGVVLDANDKYLRTLGYTREDLRAGKVRWTDMTPPEWKALNARASEQLATSGFATPWEKEYFRKDGSRVPVMVGIAMLENSKNISFFVDLTEQKEAEARLRATENQLRQAQKMDAIGRLAGGVAHDFNNVLSVILGYTEMALGDLNTSDPLRADMEEIHKAAGRAAGLTRQLLLFSRQQVIERRVLDLDEVLASMDKMLRRILGEDVEMFVSSKSAGRIDADPSHIEQVILNLVVNARDAMPTGGKLTIETANIVLDEAYALSHLPMTAGPYVMLAVTDTGTGMDRETQAHIFEPFFTTKAKGKGTGLGLSTVFGIVQQSGGSVWVYSEPGKGTSFKIYLPRVDAEPEAPRTHVPSATLRGSETILLVEDEEQVRAVVMSLLRRQGYVVIPASSPGEAMLLSERASQKIDLLLTDVVMPQMSGPELARRLSTARPEMRVLCMSGYTDDSIVRHGVLDAAFAFVQKPITPASLARKIRELLDEGPARGKTSAPRH